MSGYFIKSPDSTLDYTFDWGFQLLQGGETIATDQGWTIHPDTAPTGGLAIASASSTPTTTTAFLSGGLPGEAYLLCSRIETSGGRTVQRSMTVRVANR